MANDLVLRSRHTVTPQGVLDAVVVVREGRIAAVVPADDPAARGAEDLGERWLLPGLVDTHVHINEPGRADWEGFNTATRAAAAGGITTLVDMPLNSVPATTTPGALKAKRLATTSKLSVDVAFWGGLVPGNLSELPALAAAGVMGFKCFLVPSGVPEFRHVSESDLQAAMPEIARLGLPLLVHAEMPGSIEVGPGAGGRRDPRRYSTWLASRPHEAEDQAMALMILLCEGTGCRTHIVHLASADAVPMAREAKRRQLPLTVETCPHYLRFEAESIRASDTRFKVAPPIRGRENREALWEALREGTIDMVVSDHSSCPPAMRLPQRGDFLAAWGGIASLELGLPIMWAEARGRGFTPADLARWMSAEPAKLAGLDATKGAIAPGRDADLVVWDSEPRWTVEAERLHQRHAVTPYAGLGMVGRVARTYLRGRLVQDSGRFVSAPAGRLLTRTAQRAPAVG